MKIILLFASILLASFLQAQDLEIVDATSQKWTGGRARSGHGINYRLAIVCKKKMKKLEFKNLWVGKEAFPVKFGKNITNKPTFFKNDTIYLLARKVVKTNEYGDEIEKGKRNETPPLEYTSAGLLSYKTRKKSKSIQILKFRELKAIYYP